MQIRYFQKIFFIFLSSLFFLNAQTTNVETVFGPIELRDELLEVYNLEHMQRLKGIDQSGTPSYWNGIPSFTRLDHSLDTLWLVKTFRGNLKEQIASFTHDISHTVFSHVADIFFDTPNYQDAIHEWFLKQTGIGQIIKKFGWKEQDICPDQPEFKRLEQPLPDMCADRIGYNIRTGFVFKLLTRQDIDFIVSKLHFEKGRWYFSDVMAAKKFAYLPLKFTETFWGSSDNFLAYYLTSKILKRAFFLRHLTKDDMHFGTDAGVLKKLEDCHDPEIDDLIANAQDLKKAYEVLQDNSYEKPDYFPKPKFRGIDPWIKLKGSHKFKRLSKIDIEFSKEYKLQFTSKYT